MVFTANTSGPYGPDDLALTYTVYLVLALRPLTRYTVAPVGLDMVTLGGTTLSLYVKPPPALSTGGLHLTCNDGEPSTATGVAERDRTGPGTYEEKERFQSKFAI